MVHAVGTRLGPYEVLGPLGSGGMGDVYRAKDTRLDRFVAIKVAKERFSERFEREARAIAQLNHPHICTLHDVGPDYLVMELVDGETLAARLHKGAIEASQAFKLAAQIADGLAAAHAAGIVHRDLKPQNIMLTRNGVKILDFGLAKALHDVTQTATAVVMGTPAYMPPEQREGKATDARTDNYALGLVLLEMLTGGRPDPEHPRVPDGLPPLVSHALARCLARDPDARWQSARDLSSVLTLAAADGAPVRHALERPRLTGWLALAATVALAVAAAIGAMTWRRSVAPAVPTRLTISPPPGTTFPTVQQAGPPAVSPNGRYIAFVADATDGQRLLWVRSFDAFDPRPLPGSDGARNPGWSPDGRSLTFLADNNLKRVDLDGGETKVLAAATALAGSASWSGNGQILWSNGTELFVIAANGGERSQVTTRDATQYEENHYAPSFLPDNRHYLFLVRSGVELKYHLCVGELGSARRQVLLPEVTSAHYAPPSAGLPGSVLYVREGRLMARPFDTDRLTFIGEARLIADRVATHGFGIIGDFSVSPAGVLVYREPGHGTQELVWIDRTGRVVGGIGDRFGNRRNNVRLSPNGQIVAFTRQDNDVQDIWTHDLARNVPSRVTFEGGRSPVWSPDGAEIAYLRQDVIVRKHLAGGPEVVIWKGTGILSLNDWSGDGHHLLLTRWDTSAGMDGRGLWLISEVNNPSARHEPALLEARALHGQFAPATGAPRWIAFDAAGTFVRTMPGAPPGRWQVSTAGGNAVRWRPDARELFFVSGPSFVSVDVDAGPIFRASAPRTLFVAPGAIRTAMSQYALGYDVAADGQRFLTTFPQPESSASVINVVINWPSALLDR